MAIQLKNVYTAQLGATDTTMYTCPANTVAVVKKCTACNDTTTIPTFDVNKVPSGGSVGDDNLLINTKPLGANETYECPEVVGCILNEGDLLSGIASGASQVTVNLDVIEMIQA